MKKITIMTICCCFMACLVTGTGFAIAPGGCVVEEKQLGCAASGDCPANEEMKKQPLKKAEPGTVEVKLTEAAQKIEISSGDQLKIIVAGNPTTGYSWEIEDFKPSLLELTERSFVAEPVGADKQPMVGAGGSEVFVFRAKKSGESQITFWYKRPWEKDAEPAKSYILTVEIK